MISGGNKITPILKTIAAEICPSDQMEECLALIEDYKEREDVPDEFLDELLAGKEFKKGLIQRCGGYYTDISGKRFTKNSAEVAGCVMGHLRKPSIRFFEEILYFKADEIPEENRPHSLQEATGLYKSDLSKWQKASPSKLAGTPISPIINAPITRVLWEQRLAYLGFAFTHINEWHPVETKIPFGKEGTRYWQTVAWYYWLEQNGDGSYKLYWEMTPKTTQPTTESEKVEFRLDANNQYPGELTLVILGELEPKTPLVQGIKIVLK